MAPRAAVIWSSLPVGSERFRRRLDERHRELTVQAKLRGRSYRRSRDGVAADDVKRLRSEFLASLGRLTAFEGALVALSRCRYDMELSDRADLLTRDYLELWQVVARRGRDRTDLEQRSSELLDQFATQLGRLEGLADALLVAGRNVRLLPLPASSWLPVERTRA